MCDSVEAVEGGSIDTLIDEQCIVMADKLAIRQCPDKG